MRNEGLSRNDPERKQWRKERADARKAVRDLYSDSEQIRRLDDYGFAAEKERAKLALRIAARKEVA